MRWAAPMITGALLGVEAGLVAVEPTPVLVGCCVYVACLFVITVVVAVMWPR